MKIHSTIQQMRLCFRKSFVGWNFTNELVIIWNLKMLVCPPDRCISTNLKTNASPHSPNTNGILPLHLQWNDPRHYRVLLFKDCKFTTLLSHDKVAGVSKEHTDKSPNYCRSHLCFNCPNCWMSLGNKLVSVCVDMYDTRNNAFNKESQTAQTQKQKGWQLICRTL